MPGRIVITGIGPVTSIGTGAEAFWKGLLGGRCGIGPVRSFDTSRFKVYRGAEVTDLRAGEYVRRQDPARLGRTSQFAVAAARLALADAGLEPGALDLRRTGVCLGTTSGEPCLIERLDDACLRGESGRAAAEFAVGYPCHVVTGHVAREFGLRGVNLVVPMACAAGNHALAHAFDLLQADRADVMLAGGAESFSRITFTGFARLGAIAPDLCRPFDRSRKGMIPGEGAAVLVLERADRAARRGARVYAEVLGYGLSCDATHMTGMHPDGMHAARAMENALRDAGLAPEQVAYVSAHGTGTVTNDRVETLALKRALGPTAGRIPVSSIKAMLGHTMGAAAAIEAAACALAITHGRVPPTIHLEEPDPECDLDYVPGTARECPVPVALSCAYGFGGNNSALVLGRAEI